MLCRRVAKSTGASVVTTLADMDGKESFDASSLGQCDEVSAIQLCVLTALCIPMCVMRQLLALMHRVCGWALVLSLFSISAM